MNDKAINDLLADLAKQPAPASHHWSATREPVQVEVFTRTDFDYAGLLIDVTAYLMAKGDGVHIHSLTFQSHSALPGCCEQCHASNGIGAELHWGIVQ